MDNNFKDEMRSLGINADDIVDLGNDMESDIVVDNSNNKDKIKKHNLNLAVLITTGLIIFLSVVMIAISVSYKITMVDVQGTSFSLGPVHFVSNEYNVNPADIKPGARIIYSEQRDSAFIGPFLKSYKTGTVVREKNQASIYVDIGQKDLINIQKSSVIYILNSYSNVQPEETK